MSGLKHVSWATVNALIGSAIARLETARRYGPDMLSSKELAVGDAVMLLETALKILESKKTGVGESGGTDGGDNGRGNT